MQTSFNFMGELADVLETIRQRRDLPSLSGAVTVAGEVVWKGACGLATLEPPRAATSQMVYPLGSITKVFITTMLMQLVERGVVSLEDPLVKYVPEYRVVSPFPNTPPTTLRQLAAHTSGLPRDAAINFPMNLTLGAWEFSDGKAELQWYVSAEAVLASLPTVELELPPDTGKIYSNLGVMLLAIALERACNQDFHEYLTENVFIPLGMTSAGFVDRPGAWDERFPIGYGRSSQGEAPFVAPRWQLGGAIYTGGIYSTAEDLAMFGAAFMRDDSPILSSPGMARMIHPSAMGDTNLGWWKGWHAGYTNYGHAGAHVGFTSAVLFVPELKLCVAVQTNRFNPVFDTNDSTETARELLAYLNPQMVIDRLAFDPAQVDITSYPGVYRLPGDFASIEVSIQNGLLKAAVQGVEEEPMLLAPVGPHQFGPPGTQFPAITFKADSQGNISSLSYALFEFKRE